MKTLGTTPDEQHTRLRSRLLVPFVISNLIIISMALYTVSYFESMHETDFHNTKRVDIINNFDKVVSESTELHQALIKMIQSNRDVLEAWLEKDVLALLNATDPMFNYLSEQHKVTHFYFHNIDKTVFLRLHNKDLWGDKNSRVTLQTAAASGKPASGIEYGNKGAFVLRTVFPWYVDETLVGYIELGEELDGILHQVAEMGSVEMALVVHKSLKPDIETISRSPLKSEFTVGRQDTDLVFLYTTSETIAETYLRVYPSFEHISGTELHQLEHEDRVLLSASFPVKNAAGENQAYIIFSSDISEFVQTEEALLKSIASIIILISILLIVFYYFYSGRLQKYLSEIYNKLNHEIKARMDSEVKLEIYSRQLEDEVEQRTEELTRTNEELERDIELRKRTEEQFRRSEKKYRTLFENTPDATLVADGNRFADCNNVMIKLLGYSTKQELLDLHPSDISPEFQSDGSKSWEKAEQMMKIAYERGSNLFEWDHRRANGEVFPAEVSLTSIPMGDRNILYAVIRDITDRKKDEETIRRQAFYDSLTGLPNRVLLHDRLQQAVIHANRFKTHGAVFFMDLDQFKKINDSLGHSVGDSLLIEVANRITSCLREGDTAARLGGDEFVVLLPDLPADENSYNYAEKVAEKIKNAINQTFHIEQYELKISTSIGISLFAGKNEQIDDVLRHADTAMYRAKDDGRNSIRFFLPSMQAEVVKRLNMEKELVDAFENGELELHYQPQYSLHHDLYGVEALLRWQHKTRGFIPPLQFISIAEEIGLIVPMSHWILKKAMQDMQEIMQSNKRALGRSMRLSINLSPLQFLQDDFILSIRKGLDEARFPAHLLTLEITENVIINNVDDTVAKCYQLKEMGIHISLDDFGTGYSSLSYLKKLPINELKIDRSFIRDIETDRNDSILVESIISLAHHFNLALVAEGVETLEQLNFLMNHNCDAYQGYYFSKPLTSSDLAALFLKQKTRSGAI
ncbi:MAG: EAL domain-containing protein [Gammaproteobacteria bacterium]